MEWSLFTLRETICLKFWANSLSKKATNPLLPFLKLPIKIVFHCFTNFNIKSHFCSSINEVKCTKLGCQNMYPHFTGNIFDKHVITWIHAQQKYKWTWKNTENNKNTIILSYHIVVFNFQTFGLAIFLWNIVGIGVTAIFNLVGTSGCKEIQFYSLLGGRSWEVVAYKRWSHMGVRL